MIFESDVERHLVKRVKSLGGEAIKMSAGEGWPDRLCVLPGGRGEVTNSVLCPKRL